MRYLVFLLLIFPAMSSLLSAADAVTSEESKKIIGSLYSRFEQGYKKYSGFIAIRTTRLKISDAISGKLLDDNESVVKIKGNYYGPPEVIQVIRFIKNGQEQPVSKFTERKSSQFYPVFDSNGRERYSIAVTGFKKVNNTDCYILKITPRQISPLHFSGDLYVSKKGLDLIANEGGPAANETGVKSFYFFTIYKTIDSMPVIVSTHIDLLIHVPVFFPNKKMVMDIDFRDQELFLK